MRAAAGLLAAALAAAACGGSPPDPAERTSLVAAGDIASCYYRGDELTARLLDRIGGVVAPLGDNVYPSGTDREFAECYEPTWGRHRERSRPAVGNHEYRTEGAAGYFRYFGERAGEAGKGWYSYPLDGWHVIVLNSDVEMGPGSEQHDWLLADLAANPSRCTLAYFHHPRFSSGKHGGKQRAIRVFPTLYEAGVDVVLSAHDHHYERFAPQDPEGRPDPERGIRQFVVGTGGAPSYRLRAESPQTEAIAGHVRGVLRLVFHPDSYEWEFVAVQGRSFHDAGRATCND